MTTEQDGEWVSYKDTFPEAFLKDAYVMFDEYIKGPITNEDNFAINLIPIVEKYNKECVDLWSKHYTVEQIPELLSFCVAHCLARFFFLKFTNTEELNLEEKRWFTAWRFFIDGQGVEDYDLETIEQQYVEMRDDLVTSEAFMDSCVQGSKEGFMRECFKSGLK